MNASARISAISKVLMLATPLRFAIDLARVAIHVQAPCFRGRVFLIPGTTKRCGHDGHTFHQKAGEITK